MSEVFRGTQVQAVAILFLTLAWISVSVRCYVRIFMSKIFRIDDWLAVLTLVVFSVFCGFVLAGEKYGTGTPGDELAPGELEIGMKLWYCGEITYLLTTCLVKVYIGVFLMQICVYKSQLMVIWVVITTFSAYTVYFLFVMILQCHPISYFWTKSAGAVDGSCLSSVIITASTYAHAGLSTAADWTLGILPIFLVRNLNMNPRTKFSVALILALGAIGSTATIIRIPFISQLMASNDFLYLNTDVSIWSTVEPGMGITASSIACMRPLFQAFLSRSRSIGSESRDATPWKPAHTGCIRSNYANGVEELHLHPSLARAIRVTTVIDTSSARQTRDLEAGDDLAKAGIEGAKTMIRNNRWDTY